MYRQVLAASCIAVLTAIGVSGCKCGSCSYATSSYVEEGVAASSYVVSDSGPTYLGGGTIINDVTIPPSPTPKPMDTKSGNANPKPEESGTQP